MGDAFILQANTMLFLSLFGIALQSQPLQVRWFARYAVLACLFCCVEASAIVPFIILWYKLVDSISEFLQNN